MKIVFLFNAKTVSELFVGQSQQRLPVFALQDKRQVIFALVKGHIDSSLEALIFFLDDAFNKFFDCLDHDHFLEDDYIVIQEGAICIVLEDLKVIDLEIEINDGSFEFVCLYDGFSQHFLSRQADEDNRRGYCTDCLCYLVFVDDAALAIAALDEDLFL